VTRKENYTDADRDVLSATIAENTTPTETGCLVWEGKFAGRSPIIHTRLKGGRRLYATVKRFLMELEHPGTRYTRGTRFTNTCGDYRCVNPAHLTATDEDLNKALEAIAWLKQYGIRFQTNQEMAKAYGCTAVTIGKYRAMYAKDPLKWDKLIEGFKNVQR
jgi:hypothetical protein